MSDDELREHYRSQVRESFQVSRGESVGLNETDSGIIEDVLGAGAGRRALEVGCYTGFMLDRLRKAGWDVEGLEPNEQSAAVAQSRFGLRVHTTMLEDFSTDRGYDLVFIGGVLEHVRSPTSALLDVNRLLDIGGYFYLRAPDVEQIMLETVADVFHIDHPHMFSQNAVRMLAEKTGFEVVVRRTHDQSRRSALQNLVFILRKIEDRREPGPFELRNRHDEMVELLRAYDQHIREQRRSIDLRLVELLGPEPKRVAIYGAGTHTNFLLRYTSLAETDLRFVVDSNPEKWGTELGGLSVRSPDELTKGEVEMVVISSRAFQHEIYDRIKHLEGIGIGVVRLYDSST